MVQAGGIAGDQLRRFIERIERLEEEKKGIGDDIKEVYAGAKSIGFDTKVMRKVIALRKLDKADRQEMEALIDVYEHALEFGVQSTADGCIQFDPSDFATRPNVGQSIEFKTKAGVVYQGTYIEFDGTPIFKQSDGSHVDHVVGWRPLQSGDD